jgi:hypothetical protein
MSEFQSGYDPRRGPGRPPGSKNRRTQEILDLLQERGDKDPLDFLSSVISSENHYPAELKLSAANYLAPYLHSKYGNKIPPRYIMEPVELPHPEPTSIEQANININYISARKAAGTLDLDFADSLINDNRVIANNLIAQEELQLKLADHGGPANQTIRIEGGLPELPGTNVIMPHMNGVFGQGTELNHNGHTIEHVQTTEANDQEKNAGPQTQDQGQ